MDTIWRLTVGIVDNLIGRHGVFFLFFFPNKIECNSNSKKEIKKQMLLLPEEQSEKFDYVLYNLLEDSGGGARA